MNSEHFERIEHCVDVCVVGGGLAGICAAVSAARNGAVTALVQDRPMLGGNASSEIRMWICGAHGRNNRETGIIEELMLENLYRNPYKNYSIWDSVMLGIVRREPLIQLYLNCSCLDGKTENGKIESILAWQTTTQKYHCFKAKIFIDCSGDSILAPISGAEYRIGREGRTEYGESIAPEVADNKTMGLSCMLQARECREERKFVAPDFAEKLSDNNFSERAPDLRDEMENFWYLELGGNQNTIDDAEKLRDRLVSLAYGTWDYLKNSPKYAEKNKNYDLEWVGILPGKRESRRYIGDYVMTQNDIESGGHFDDIIAYGGWTMDDHNPDGFDGNGAPNIHHPAPSPYGIPYRCIYSKTIENLMFAGRNISVTHSALSSTRVMATCGVIGQAAGAAAAMAVHYSVKHRDIGQRISELQQLLQQQDIWLPFVKKKIGAATLAATIRSNMKNTALLFNGIERETDRSVNYACGEKGSRVNLIFDKPVCISGVRLVFDSDLNRETLPDWERRINRNMIHNIPLGLEPSYPPKTLMRRFTVTLTLDNGETESREINNYYQRLFIWKTRRKIMEASVTLEETWGSPEFHLFSFEVIE